uniref:Uncharacterized protein LOC105138056 isoform X2 n=1 Tax=Rhizophora mucronata TaxID=61149 RepID=A0A2P2II16_RHIMU
MPNVVESAQQKTESQVNAENIEVESKKKSKRKQSSDPDSQLKLQSEIEDVGHKAPDMDQRKDDSSIDKINNRESNMPLKKGKEISEKHRNSTSFLPTGRELEEVMDQKSRKKSKRKHSSDPKIPSKLQSEIKDVGHKSLDVGTRVVDSSTDKFHDGESNVPLNKGKELSDLDKDNTSLLATDREIDNIIKNVVNSVQQMRETQVNGDKVNRKSREKTKKKQSPVSSTDNTKEVDSSSKSKAHLTNPHPSAQLNGSNFMHELGTGAEDDDLTARLNSTAIESSLAQVHELDGDIEHRDLGNANGIQQKRRHADESPSNMEATCGSNALNFSDYFVHKQFNNETVASGEVFVAEKTKAMGADNEKKAKRNKPKLDGHSGSGVKVAQSSKSDEPNSIAKGGKRYVRPSGCSAYTNNNKEIFSTSNSLGSPKSRNVQNKSINGHRSHDVHTDGRKAFATKAGEVVDGSRREKGLIGTSGAIFKDDSHGSSTDEDVVGNSGSSTRTPSDNSVTSDYTDGESDIDFNLPQNGSDRLKRKEAVATDIGSSGITLDSILRRSNRFKKAKLTASQSQLEETESQPVDFVPDSQANL